MPIKTARKSLKTASRAIRVHWSDQEKHRRREMAELMQRRLMAALSGREAAC